VDRRRHTHGRRKEEKGDLKWEGEGKVGSLEHQVSLTRDPESDVAEIRVALSTVVQEISLPPKRGGKREQKGKMCNSCRRKTIVRGSFTYW